jgi:hypothetical protein
LDRRASRASATTWEDPQVIPPSPRYLPVPALSDVAGTRLSDLCPDAEIVAKGFGLKDPGEVEDVLRDVADALDPRNLREALEGASLEDLVEARDEVRAVLELLNAGTVKLQIQPDILSCS